MKPIFSRTAWRFALAGAALLLCTPGLQAADKWTIHEWGTFTSLQNERGEAIGGINTDDEPVPPFVHRLAQFILLPPSEAPRIFAQGAPSCHPDVTMRLETPVIYFHPPKSQPGIQTADVKVKFRGGWLTEFYPDALPDAAGLKESQFAFPHLLSSTEGKLEWNDLQIGGDWPVTNTSAHVWTSPRNVHAATVRAATGESEKFLFYRGVGHINAPLKIARDTQSGQFLFRSQLENFGNGKPLPIRSTWIVDIRPGGLIAFRTLPAMTLESNSGKVLTHARADFEPDEYSMRNAVDLKEAIRTALVSEGLFLDEAEALLKTWELSYFKSSGLRVFFTVPREWTDYYLPLEISQSSDLIRVMVGRIELITPAQQSLVKKLANYSEGQITNEVSHLYSNFFGLAAKGGSAFETLNSGEKPLAASISVPKTYQTYLDLGRFRNALILDEASKNPSPGLDAFISAYRLQAYKPIDGKPDSAQ